MKLKQQAKASYGNSKIGVTFNSDSELERKIACMKVFNQSAEKYDEQQKEFAEKNKKYSALEGIDCSYRGSFIEGDYSKRHDFVGSIVKDLSFLDICFNCDTEMVDQKAVDNAWDMHDYNSGGPYAVGINEGDTEEDNKWKKKNDAVMVELEKKVLKLKEEGNFVVLYGRAHEVFATTLESHCPNCGNVGSITINLEPEVITDYGIRENRASTPIGKGALIYNKKEEHVWPQTDLFKKLGEHEELITHGHPSYKEMLNKLNGQQNAMIQQAMAKALENIQNA